MDGAQTAQCQKQKSLEMEYGGFSTPTPPSLKPAPGKQSWDCHSQIRYRLGELEETIDRLTLVYRQECSKHIHDFASSMHAYVQPVRYEYVYVPCVPTPLTSLPASIENVNFLIPDHTNAQVEEGKHSPVFLAEKVNQLKPGEQKIIQDKEEKAKEYDVKQGIIQNEGEEEEEQDGEQEIHNQGQEEEQDGEQEIHNQGEEEEKDGELEIIFSEDESQEKDAVEQEIIISNKDKEGEKGIKQDKIQNKEEEKVFEKKEETRIVAVKKTNEEKESLFYSFLPSKETVVRQVSPLLDELDVNSESENSVHNDNTNANQLKSQKKQQKRKKKREREKKEKRTGETMLLVLDYWCSYFYPNLRICYEAVEKYRKLAKNCMLETLKKGNPNQEQIWEFKKWLRQFQKAYKKLQYGPNWMIEFEEERFSRDVFENFFEHLQSYQSSFKNLYRHILTSLHLDAEGKIYNWKQQKILVCQMCYLSKLEHVDQFKTTIIKALPWIQKVWIRHKEKSLSFLLSQLRKKRGENCLLPSYCLCGDMDCAARRVRENCQMEIDVKQPEKGGLEDQIIERAKKSEIAAATATTTTTTATTTTSRQEQTNIYGKKDLGRVIGNNNVNARKHSKKDWK